MLLFPSTQFLYLLDEELGVRGRAQEGGGSFIYMCVDTSKSEMNHRLIVKHHTTPQVRRADAGETEAPRGAATVMGFLGLLPIIRRAYWSALVCTTGGSRPNLHGRGAIMRSLSGKPQTREGENTRMTCISFREKFACLGELKCSAGKKHPKFSKVETMDIFFK